MDADNKILAWFDFEHKPKTHTIDWYWGVAITSLVLMGIVIYYNNYLFAALIFIAVATLLYSTTKAPNMVHYEINTRGVKVNKTLYPFQTLEAFWIETRHTDPKLLVRSSKNIMPLIILPLEKTNLDQVQALLNGKITEEEIAEPFAHIIMDRLGF